MNDDDVLRREYRRQGRKARAGQARGVRVDGGVVLHPDDRDAQLTRAVERRRKTTKRGRR